MNNPFALKQNWTMLAVLMMGVLLVAGCSSSSGDDDDDSGDDDFTASSITFEPDSGSGDQTIWLALAGASPETNSFVLNVIGQAIDSTYGVAGRLEFDLELTALGQAQAGNALESNNAQILALGGPNDKGGVFGFSRSGDYEHSVTLSKDKIIGTLHLTVLGAGQTKIDFDDDRSHVIDHDLDALEVTDWIGGTLTVQ